jgi:cell division protein FtsB
MANAFQKRAIDVGFAILIVGAVAYFGMRTIQGESGFFAKLAIETEERRLSAELTVVKAERAALENLTKRLSDNYLDLDLLDERARDVLGYARSDEIVIR